MLEKLNHLFYITSPKIFVIKFLMLKINRILEKSLSWLILQKHILFINHQSEEVIVVWHKRHHNLFILNEKITKEGSELLQACIFANNQFKEAIEDLLPIFFICNLKKHFLPRIDLFDQFI